MRIQRARSAPTPAAETVAMSFGVVARCTAAPSAGPIDLPCLLGGSPPAIARYTEVRSNSLDPPCTPAAAVAAMSFGIAPVVLVGILYLAKACFGSSDAPASSSAPASSFAALRFCVRRRGP